MRQIAPAEAVPRISIGEAAKRSGVKIATIRYYEQIGLLVQPARTDSNRRLYGLIDLACLAFIRHARELGFDLGVIRTLLELQRSPQQPCSEIDSIAKQRLADIDMRIASLLALKAELEHMIKGCHRGKIKNCRIIEVLSDHALCRHHVGRKAALTPA